MKLLKVSRIAVLILVSSLISNCTNMADKGSLYQTPQRNHQLTDISKLSDREKADLYEAIIAADLAAANGEYDLATSYYLLAARTSKSLDLVDLLVDSARKSHDNLAILQAAEIWLEIEPQNIEAVKLKIAGLLSQQEVQQAVELTEQLILKTDLEDQYDIFVEVSSDQSPPVSNAYFAELSKKHPVSPSVLTARAAFFYRVAKLTPNPKSVIAQAFQQVDQVLAINDSFFPAVELKTRLFYQARQDEKAEAMLRKLHTDYPSSQPISQLLGQLLYDLRKYDLATQHFSSWLKSHKNDTEARFFLAASYFATAQYSKSLAEYQQILGKDYKPQLAYFFCGNSAVKIKQYDQAIACYQLVESGKYLTRAKLELAKVYALTGKIDKALAVVTNPNNASDEATQVQLINLEIDLLNKHKSNQKAKQRLSTALRNYPKNINLMLKEISIYQLGDKPKELVELLIKARSQLTKPERIHQFNLTAAAMLRRNHHYQQAVDWLNDALENEPQDKEYLYARTLYKEPLGLYDEMIADFKHLLTLEPENINVKNALGYTLADLNRELDYAGELIEQAYLAMPNNAAVIDSKGWLAFRQGANKKAIKFLTLALKMSPSADVATHLGEVYWVLGDQEKALTLWKKASQMDPENYLLKTTTKRLKVKLPEETNL